MIVPRPSDRMATDLPQQRRLIPGGEPGRTTFPGWGPRI